MTFIYICDKIAPKKKECPYRAYVKRAKKILKPKKYSYTLTEVEYDIFTGDTTYTYTLD